MSSQEIQTFKSGVDVGSVESTDINSSYKSSLSALQVVKVLHSTSVSTQEHGMGFAPAFFAFRSAGGSPLRVWEYYNADDFLGTSLLSVDETTVYFDDTVETFIFLLKEPLDE